MAHVASCRGEGKGIHLLTLPLVDQAIAVLPYPVGIVPLAIGNTALRSQGVQQVAGSGLVSRRLFQ
jgi:hypothetical protein